MAGCCGGLGVVSIFLIGFPSILFFSGMLIFLSFCLFFLSYDKMHSQMRALDIANDVIKKLTEENQDYKRYTDVLLHDPEVKKIMADRMSNKQNT